MDTELLAFSLDESEAKSLLKHLLKTMESDDIVEVLEEELDDDTKAELAEGWFVS